MASIRRSQMEGRCRFLCAVTTAVVWCIVVAASEEDSASAVLDAARASDDISQCATQDLRPPDRDCAATQRQIPSSEHCDSLVLFQMMARRLPAALNKAVATPAPTPPERLSSSVSRTGQDAAAPQGGTGSLFYRRSVELLSSRVWQRVVPQHRVRNMNAASVAVDVEYHGVVEEIITFPERRPWAFNVIVATLKTCIADLVVQVTDRRPSTDASSSMLVGWKGIDWRRTLFFAIFGCLYVGMVQWLFYVSLVGWLCPDALAFANKPIASKLTDTVGQEELLLQVFADQLILNPFIYFPTFYIVKEAFFGPRRGPIETVFGGLRRYGSNFMEDNTASLCIWFPADFLIFTAPMYLRMPLDHAVSFVWTMIISYMRGGAKPSTVHREAKSNAQEDSGK